MTFEQLVTRVMEISGLSPIQASRLVTMNIYFLTRDAVTAAGDPEVSPMIADQLIEVVRASVADNLNAVIDLR